MHPQIESKLLGGGDTEMNYIDAGKGQHGKFNLPRGCELCGAISFISITSISGFLGLRDYWHVPPKGFGEDTAVDR